MRSSIIETCILHTSLALGLGFAAVGCTAEPAAEGERSSTSHLVSPSDVDGHCGSSNVQILAQKPTSGLCTSGTASDVSGGPTGPWDWSCAGVGTGTLANCSALSTNIYVPNADRDRHGVLIKTVYQGIFGFSMPDYVYYYWVDRYNPANGVNCREITQAFLLATPARNAAAAATEPKDPALTGYIEMQYRAILPAYPGDNTAEIAGWRTSNQLTMYQLDGIFLDNPEYTARCADAGMQ
jgi:hypothetical protein